MSIKALTWAFGMRAPSPGSKWALVALADSADDDGVVILGRKSLAEKCQVNAATSSGHLKALEAANLIWRKERRRTNGSRTSDWIVLAPEAEDRGPMLDATTEKREDADLLAKAQVRKPNPRPEVYGQVFGGGQVRKPRGPYDPSEDPSENSSKEESAQADLFVPEDRAERFFDFHASLIERETGRRPAKTKSAMAAARSILRMANGDAAAIRARIEWALAQPRFWPEQAASLAKLNRRWPELCLGFKASQNVRDDRPTAAPTRREYDTERRAVT